MHETPSDSTVHEGAVAMLWAGNTLAFVAGFFGLPVDAVRSTMHIQRN